MNAPRATLGAALPASAGALIPCGVIPIAADARETIGSSIALGDRLPGEHSRREEPREE